MTGQIFFRSYGKVIFSALYNLSFICYSYCRMTSEEKIKARIEKLLFLAIFIVGFLSGFSFLIPYLQHLNDKPIVSGIVDAGKNTLGAKTAKGEVIGFLPYWIISEKTPVYPQNLTQLIYFNVEADEKGNLLLNDKNGNLTPEWKFFFTDYFQDLKTQAKLAETKVLVAVTNFNIESIDKLIRSKTAGANFASNIAGLLANFDLDGINIDFEYTTDEKLPDSFYLSKFLTELRSEMNKAKKENILSIDLMANALVKNADFDLQKIAESVDQIIVMTYDYSHPGSETAGPVAPLYGGFNERSVNEVISLLRGKIEDHKIVMGIPLYGYEWQTESTSYRSAVSSDSPVALASYKRLKELTHTQKNLKVNWNDIAKSPWINYWDGNNKQIYFENDLSLENKVHYAYKNNLGGVALWALGYDGGYLEPWQIIRKYF